jgi:CHAD domain-containing protein/CYTH domain-containing protein
VASPKTPILEVDVRDAVARIADSQLRHAAKALARLRDPGDRTALHNFRVAIRRLRSLLRAYRPWIGRAGSKKPQRRLRRLTRTTGVGRDAEVQIEWLARQRLDLERSERAGADWLLRKVRAHKRNYDRAARKTISADFERLEKSLRKRLDRMDETEPKPFREAFSELLDEHADRFFKSLTDIRTAEDHGLIHKARIEAKRLRYIVEPLRAVLPEARAVTREMKRVQDLLGQLHDIHLLESALQAAVEEVARERAHRVHALAIAGDKGALARAHRKDEQLGLVQLAIRARRERDALFAMLDRRWIRDRAAELASLVRILRAVCLPGNTVEIERKYLLKSLPPHARSAPADEIEQGWLPGERVRERLRRIVNGEGEQYRRTIKLGAGMQRVELEDKVTPKLFRALWPLTAGCRVHKRRYRVPDGALTWEIDQFLDRDLVLAEVELPDPAATVELPKWLEDYVVREVTDDPEFLNLNLGR